MNFITNRIFKVSALLNKNIRCYGEITFTQQLERKSEFEHVHAYRAYDLDGQLLDRNVKFDLPYMNKILKAMIYVDEMDSILLKVKGQGMLCIKLRKNIFLYDFFRIRSLYSRVSCCPSTSRFGLYPVQGTRSPLLERVRNRSDDKPMYWKYSWCC